MKQTVDFTEGLNFFEMLEVAELLGVKSCDLETGIDGLKTAYAEMEAKEHENTEVLLELIKEWTKDDRIWLKFLEETEGPITGSKKE